MVEFKEELDNQKREAGRLRADAKKFSEKERALTVENDDLKAQIARIEKEQNRMKEEIERAKKQAEDADKRAERFKNLRVFLHISYFQLINFASNYMH